MNKLTLKIVIVALVAFSIYIGTVRYTFVWDDKFLILENRYLKNWSELKNNLTSDFFRKSRDTSLIGYWRPIVTLSYMIDRTLYHDHPWGFHLLNALLHVIASCLVLVTLGYLPLPRGVPLGAALLFAVHPVHVESVAWISGRTDLFCAVFFLAAVALDCANSRAPEAVKRWGSVAATILALLSKEMAAIIPVVIACRGLILPGDAERDRGRFRSAVWNTLPHAIILIVYMIVHFMILNINIPQPQWARVGRPVLFWTWWTGLLEYMRVLVWPAVLSIAIDIHHETSIFSLNVIAGMFLFIAFAALAIMTWKKNPMISFMIWFFLVSLAPLTNFIFPIAAPSTAPFAWSERFLYLPSVPFCAVAAWIVLKGFPDLISRRKKRSPARNGPPVWSVLILAIIIVAATSRSLVRARDWKDNLSLFSSALSYAPKAALVHVNYGVALSDLGRADEAEKEYQKALELSPTEYRAYYNLGNVYRQRGELEKAEGAYRSAIRIKANHAQSYLNLGLVLLEENKIQEALNAFTAANEFLPDYVDAMVNRANTLRLLNKSEEALQFYQEALEIDPSLPQARLGLAGAYMDLGRNDEAAVILRRLIVDNPNMAEAHLLLAIYFDAKGMKDQAEDEYREVLRIDPDNQRALKRLGLTVQHSQR